MLINIKLVNGKWENARNEMMGWKCAQRVWGTSQPVASKYKTN